MELKSEEHDSCTFLSSHRLRPAHLLDLIDRVDIFAFALRAPLDGLVDAFVDGTS